MNLEPYLADFSVENPVPLAETPRAKLWRVDAQSGPAVLKVFSARGLKVGDTIGTKLLQLWDGDGAVRVIKESKDALLLELLGGPSLAQSMPRGRDDDAAEVRSKTWDRQAHSQKRRPRSGGGV